MKSLKLVLVAAILSLAMVGYAKDTKKHTAKKAVKISLNEAVKSPKLVVAMYGQLELCKLKSVKPGFCCGWVNVGSVVYKIYAPQQAWIRFFREKPGKKIRVGRSFQSPE